MVNETQIIHINSDDRNRTSWENPNKFRVEIPRTIKDVSVLRFMSCNIPNNWYNVPTNKRNMVVSINGTSNISVSLTAGVYNTTASLITELKSKLDTAGLSKGDGSSNVVFTITEDTTTKLLKFAYTNCSTAFAFEFSNSNWSLKPQTIGYSSYTATDKTGSTTEITSEIPPDMLWAKFLFIKFTNIHQPVESTNTNLNANFIIPNNGSAKMTNIISFNNYQMINRITPTDIRFLDIELRDDNNDLIDIRGSWQMVIEIAQKNE